MKRIVCLGDSLTEGSGLEINRIWPALVANGLGNVEVLNKGIGGDTTGGMLARVYPDVVASKPDLVMIVGGTNDLWAGLDGRMIAANLSAIACQARYHGISPLIGTPLPFVQAVAQSQPWQPPPEGYGAMAAQLEILREALNTAAEGSEIPLVDLYGAFCDANGTVATHYFMEDGIHPNYPGHQRMAQAALAVLQREFLCR